MKKIDLSINNCFTQLQSPKTPLAALSILSLVASAALLGVGVAMRMNKIHFSHNIAVGNTLITAGSTGLFASASAITLLFAYSHKPSLKTSVISVNHHLLDPISLDDKEPGWAYVKGQQADIPEGYSLYRNNNRVFFDNTLYEIWDAGDIASEKPPKQYIKANYSDGPFFELHEVKLK